MLAKHPRFALSRCRHQPRLTNVNPHRGREYFLGFRTPAFVVGKYGTVARVNVGEVTFQRDVLAREDEKDGDRCDGRRAVRFATADSFWIKVYNSSECLKLRKTTRNNTLLFFAFFNININLKLE